jgi:hypothetical protein
MRHRGGFMTYCEPGEDNSLDLGEHVQSRTRPGFVEDGQ